MSFNPEDYTRYTQNLALGGSRKVPHEGCSSSNSLKIEHKIEGVSFYCFKCHEYFFESNHNSPREKLRRQKIYEAQQRIKDERSYDLPSDFSHSIPPRGLAWLGRGGWTQEMIARYNIGYSKEMNRVILPVVDNCIHNGYTARAIEEWQTPKYLEMLSKECMWKSHKIPANEVAESLGPLKKDTDSCVLCEDILSAGRCGEFIQSYALLGTSLSTALLSTFVGVRTLLLWLDPDKGGQQGTIRILPRLRLICDDVRVVSSVVDPKLLTDTQIKEKLNVN